MSSITIDFDDPAHQRRLAAAINDPGQYVPRADHYREELVYWQLRAINEAFDPSPPTYIQARDVAEAEAFAKEHSLGHRNKHWFYATADGLRGRSTIRLLRAPGWRESRHADEIDMLMATEPLRGSEVIE